MIVENLLSELMSSGERESGIQPSSLRAMILYQATGGLYNMSHRINLLVSLYSVIARYQGVGGWKNRLVIQRLAEVSEWWVGGEGLGASAGAKVWVQGLGAKVAISSFAPFVPPSIVQKLLFQFLHRPLPLQLHKSCNSNFCTITTHPPPTNQKKTRPPLPRRSDLSNSDLILSNYSNGSATAGFAISYKLTASLIAATQRSINASSLGVQAASGSLTEPSSSPDIRRRTSLITAYI